MRVSRWGNSLAIRLPVAVVDALKLDEGDEITVRLEGPRDFQIGRDRRREAALASLRRLRRPLPVGFVFDRAEANGREAHGR